jgi:hypothetical protein
VLDSIRHELCSDPVRAQARQAPYRRCYRVVAAVLPPDLGGVAGLDCGLHQIVVPGLHEIVVDIHGCSLRLETLGGRCRLRLIVASGQVAGVCAGSA